MNETYDEEISLVTAIPGVSDVSLLARGRRGVVCTATYNNQTVAIKVNKLSAKTNNMIHLEATNLKRVNELGIGPTYITHSESYLIMEFVEGILIGEFLAAARPEVQQAVLAAAMKQCEVLDAHNINKFEMTNPYKHIIVKNDGSVVFIDFERARVTHRPKNVSQFKEYVKHFE
jgi:putative serine/threonine protein kinase